MMRVLEIEFPAVSASLALIMNASSYVCFVLHSTVGWRCLFLMFWTKQYRKLYRLMFEYRLSGVFCGAIFLQSKKHHGLFLSISSFRPKHRKTIWTELLNQHCISLMALLLKRKQRSLQLYWCKFFRLIESTGVIRSYNINCHQKTGSVVTLRLGRL